MLNKSLVAVPCGSATLCGISNRFQLLSPKQRQVAHALLTRPPLIRDRSPFTVRLECVRHAASVHPEPGSNSQNFVSNVPLGTLNLFQSFKLVCFCSFTLIKGIVRDRFSHFSVSSILDSCLCFVLSLLLFNFQGPRAAVFLPVEVADFYSTTFSSVCQDLFSTFFKSFLSSFPPSRRLDYYITSSPPCQGGF